MPEEGLEPQPTDYKSVALPIEPFRQCKNNARILTHCQAIFDAE